MCWGPQLESSPRFVSRLRLHATATSEQPCRLAQVLHKLNNGVILRISAEPQRSCGQIYILDFLSFIFELLNPESYIDVILLTIARLFKVNTNFASNTLAFLSEVAHLMSTNGIASKNSASTATVPDTVASLTNGKSAMAYALSGLTQQTTCSDDWTPESSSKASDEEDYDTLKLDPETLVAGSKGGGRMKDTTPSGRIRGDSVSTEGSTNDGKIYEPIRSRIPENILSHSIPQHSEKNGRKKSIQVILERTDKNGRYTLTADDPEIREILRTRIERETSAKGGKMSRKRFRDLVFTRQFTTFDRQNPLSSTSPFHGFFTLFWLAMALLLFKVALQNWKSQGSVFGNAEILHMMVDRDLVVMGLTDGAMTLTTGFGLLLQKLIANGYLSWNGSGWLIQSLFEISFISSVIGWTFYRDWPWTHTVFIVLHAFVFLMKTHSFSFYNGYLSQVFRRRTLLEQKLKQLDEMDTLDSPIANPRPSFSATGLDRSNPNDVLQRRRSVGLKGSTDLHSEESEIASMASAIESGEPLDPDQVLAFTRVIKSEINSLDDELKGKCTHSGNCYPKNLNIMNFADWTCLPTLVYELEYPRQERINWWYVAEKSSATLGVIWVMIIISQAYIYPVVAETVRMKEAGMTLQQRWEDFPWVVSDMLFPLLLEQLLSWYVIWECLLNVLAEVTRFADRGFYGDWWNSVSWDQYARDWNRPVHNFLLRHVYHSSISAFHLSKTEATFITFLLSAVVHEILMFCLFKKVRGYLFAMQLSQIPLAALSRTRLMKGRDTLGNLVFWIGLFVGPSLITALYLIV
ncbi:MBOAT-domain-containing protein [Lepidopterella palustris CBS 459.81]|uniref:MBOAT-domain-containing protein n=1 Tax=Lepidopterella palustris CBS 459.81 TaxID=1314670 RepID=A0A8E2JIL8_9PEZI|nr:MBOAT-domain-containing protein [Lepidopterella palustris CBS 459.81]